MIDAKKVLNSFSGIAPIFPLPDFVMFPKTAYSFNVFETRYKELVSDILNKDKLFCTSLLQSCSDDEYLESPNFHNMGTLCYVIEHKELKNGNYNIIVSGLKKVRIKEELNSDKKYRIVNLDILNENNFVDREQEKRKKLINKFMSLFSPDSDTLNLNLIDTSMISTEMLTNLGSLILPLENKDKQKLLELNDIELRLEVLCQFMDSELKVENDLSNFNQIIPTNINWN